MFTPAPISAATVMLASAGSGYLLSRRIRHAGSEALCWMIAFVFWELLQIVPLQLLAILQLSGWTSRVSIPVLAWVEIAVLIAVAICHWWKPPRLITETPTASGEKLPRYILATGTVLLMSYGAFAANVFTSFPTGSDSLTYHLPLVVRWLQSGSLPIPPSRNFHFSMPGNAELSMMVLLGSGKQSTVMLASWIPAVIILICLYVLGMQLGRDRAASAAVVLVAFSIPMIEFQTFSAYVDLMGTAGILAACALLAAGGEFGPRSIVLRPDFAFLVGLAVGLSIGTKAVYYFYAALFCAFLLWTFWRNRDVERRTLLKSAALVCLGIALPSVFWFGRALAETGNPFYPMQVRVGHHVIFAGLEPSQITLPESEFDAVQHHRDWLVYPWTEWKRNPGYLRVGYGEGDGLGAMFAALVPLGIVFLLGTAVASRREARREWLLLALFAVLGLSWWLLMERTLRYGQVICLYACILSLPLISVLNRNKRRSFAALLFLSCLTTSLVCGSVPLHAMTGRLRKHLWARSAVYNYPRIIDQLPPDSTLLNATQLQEKNFALAGKRLSNRVIVNFEAPAQLSAVWLRNTGTEYVVEVVPGGLYPESALRDSGLVVVDDELVPTGERQVRWRVWKVNHVTR